MDKITEEKIEYLEKLITEYEKEISMPKLLEYIKEQNKEIYRLKHKLKYLSQYLEE